MTIKELPCCKGFGHYFQSLPLEHWVTDSLSRSTLLGQLFFIDRELQSNCYSAVTSEIGCEAEGTIYVSKGNGAYNSSLRQRTRPFIRMCTFSGVPINTYTANSFLRSNFRWHSSCRITPVLSKYQWRDVTGKNSRQKLLSMNVHHSPKNLSRIFRYIIRFCNNCPHRSQQS